MLGRLLIGAISSIATGVLLAGAALAADADLVGRLALVVDSEVAAQLELTQAQTDDLYDLLDRREEAALGVAMRSKDLTPDQLREKLLPLRIQSQKEMAELISTSQLAKLEEIAAQRDNPSYESSPSENAPDPVTDPVAEAVDSEPGEAEAEAEATETEATEKEPTESAAAEPKVVEPKTVEPKTVEPLEPYVAPSLPTDGKMLFNFRYQPWQEVLDWFAEQSDLSLVLEAPPSGTFNYTDSRRYTPAEALDILNSVLLIKGYTLVRRDRMLVLVNLEDGIPPNLVTDVSLDDLDQRGEYELVRVLFHVRNMTPEVAAEEINRMVGPQGSVVVLPRAGMLQVTETAGRIRAIQKVVQAVERPDLSQVGAIRPFDLEHTEPANVLPVLRQMLGIPGDAFSTPEGTLQVAIDTSSSRRILAFGTPEMMTRLGEVLQLVDVPSAKETLVETLQLEVYSVNQSDPEAVLLVLQTLLAEEPGTRLTTDPQTGNLVALATPSNHATIRATLSQMQNDARQIEVIPLASVDPQLALLTITKLFGIVPSDKGGKVDPRLPVIDADLTTRSLLVRASRSQIEQIHLLLDKMGESEDSVFSASDRGNVRLLPLSASEARAAVTQLDKIWPSIRSNPVRLVAPATAIRAYRPADMPPGDVRLPETPFDWDQLVPPTTQGSASPVDRGASYQPSRPAKLSRFQLASEQKLVADEPKEKSSAERTTPPRSNAPILVAPGPNGLLIASDDLEALDAYERLIEATTSQAGGRDREYAVFYLKHAKANAAADTLQKIFGGTSASGDGLLGGIASAALGDLGGGMMGDLLGLGGGGGAAATGFSSAAVDIVTDIRLNALIVYALPDDIDKIFRLLQVLDQQSGPTEVQTDGIARLIPVLNTSAEQVAEVIKQVYSDRMNAGPGGQPSPKDMMKAMMQGGKNGKGGQTQEAPKMSISVDVRSNSLVVRAPEALFAEIEKLVHQLDSEQLDSTQSTQIVSLKFSNSSAVKEALASILGDQAISSTTASQALGNNNKAAGGNSAADTARNQQEMIRRIQEFRSRMGNNAGGNRAGRPGGGRGGNNRPGR